MNGEGLGGGDCGGGVEGGAKKKEHGKEQPGHFDGGPNLSGKESTPFAVLYCILLYCINLYPLSGYHAYLVFRLLPSSIALGFSKALSRHTHSNWM